MLDAFSHFAQPYAVTASAARLLLLLLSLCAYIGVAWVRAREVKIKRYALWMAWGLHTVLVCSPFLAAFHTHTVYFGFATALSITLWLAFTVYLFESSQFVTLLAPKALLIVAFNSIAVALAEFFPVQSTTTNQALWLPLHWAAGFAAYGLLIVAAMHAWWLRISERALRLHTTHQTPPIALLTLERLMFRFVWASFILLTGTLAVGFFGESLHDTAHVWRWDHKTVFALLAWLVLLILLIGRSLLGWRGQLAIRLLDVGTLLLILSYIGSRFVLQIILGRSI